MHANSSNRGRNHHSGRRFHRPAADANAKSLAFSDSVWRNTHTDSHANAEAYTDALIPADAQAQTDSFTQSVALGQPDSNSYAESLAFGFAHRNPAAVTDAYTI